MKNKLHLRKRKKCFHHKKTKKEASNKMSPIIYLLIATLISFLTIFLWGVTIGPFAQNTFFVTGSSEIEGSDARPSDLIPEGNQEQNILPDEAKNIEKVPTEKGQIQLDEKLKPTAELLKNLVDILKDQQQNSKAVKAIMNNIDREVQNVRQELAAQKSQIASMEKTWCRTIDKSPVWNILAKVTHRTIRREYFTFSLFISRQVFRLSRYVRFLRNY
ncbi:hypothetical protein XENTR_v10000277 [Xenopus tropicalis]|nr:hypothetical protein XENTR_v10000277 [Xenopus tropicalis]